MAHQSFLKFLLLFVVALCCIGARASELQHDRRRINHHNYESYLAAAEAAKYTPVKTTAKHTPVRTTSAKKTSSKKVAVKTTAKAQTTKKPTVKTTSTKKPTVKTTAKPTTSTKKVTPKTSTSSTPSSTTVPWTLVSYNGWSYANTTQGFYDFWRTKCIDIVGPQGMHHLINVTDVSSTAEPHRANVWCWGVPKDPATQGYYDSASPYNSNCVQGPRTDYTQQEISKLGITRIGTLGTMTQVSGC